MARSLRGPGLGLAALAVAFAAGSAQPSGQEKVQDKPAWVRPPVKADHLYHKTFPSDTIRGEVSYLVYLPPEYEKARDKRYPVMYWLHGRGGSQLGVPAFTQRLTKAVEAGKTPPMIVVFVNGLINSGYEDRDGQPVETVSIKELLPHIDKTYRTIASREGRLVEGFSMGGGGAAKWGFKYPELFGAVSIFAGARMTGEGATASESIKKNAGAVRGKTAVRIVVGSQDGLVKGNRAYHELLDELKVPHEFHVIDGAGHAHPPLYDGLGDKNWEFYRRALGQKKGQPKDPPAANELPGFKLDGTRWTYKDDKLAMEGIFLRPEGEGPFPAVLISHGKGGSAESFGMNKAQEFVKWGLVCIAPNYGHAGGKAKKPEPQGRDGASEENIRCALKCLDILESLPYVDKKRIGAYGHSMGGFVTIGTAGTAPDRLKAAVVTGSGIAPKAGFAAPTAEVAGKVRTPFLILHGSLDRTVRPEQAAQFKEVLEKNKVPSRHHVFEGEGHPIDQTKRHEVYQLIRQWFTSQGVLKQ